jgi:hypothetical protein
MDHKAGLVGDPADDLDVDADGVGDTIGVVCAVGEGLGVERVARARRLERWHGAIAILHIGGVDEQAEQPTIGVDHGKALTAEDLFGGIDTAWTAASVVFTDWLSTTAADDTAPARDVGDRQRSARGWSARTDPHPARAGTSAIGDGGSSGT